MDRLVSIYVDINVEIMGLGKIMKTGNTFACFMTIFF
jgi:hypothetical protein